MPSDPAPAPEVAVLVELPELLSPDLRGGDLAAIQDVLTVEMTDVLARLGVPGTPAVTVRETAGSVSPNAAVRPFHLRINGHRCRIGGEDVQRVIGYVQGRPAVPRTQFLGLLDLAAARDGDDDEAHAALLREFLCLACRQAIAREPSVLLAPAQAAAYRRELHVRPRDGRDDSWWHAVLSRVVHQRISIADRDEVVRLLDAAPDGSSVDDVAETLIAALKSPVLELQAPRAYLSQISPEWADSSGVSLTLSREAMLEETGLIYPDVRLVADDSLHPYSLRPKINDLVGIPWVGLQPSHCLVNAEPARMAPLGIAAESAINPGTGIGASIVPIEERERLEHAGWTTWTPAEHAMLCLSSVFRVHAACFVETEAVATLIGIRESYQPELVRAVRETLGLPRLTAALRRLVAQGTPLIDLSHVLHLLLQYDAREDATDRLRERLQRPLLRRWALGTERDLVVGFLASEPLEASVLAIRPDEPDEAAIDRVLDVLQDEIDFLPGGAGMPVLVCSPQARSALCRQITREFPRVAVLSSQELPPTAKVELLGELKPRNATA